MTSPKTTAPDASARQTQDVMTFGQELGRVLSDGRIVGRAEPFAKVFPSSRAVKRAVGLMAWGILEDIAMDASIDDRGRLVAETNARRIATNLDLSKTTVHTHLGKLREFGFVVHEEMRHAATGRYEVSRYVIDPTACIERFTTTPGGGSEPASAIATNDSARPGPEAGETGVGARQVARPPVPAATAGLPSWTMFVPNDRDIDSTLPDLQHAVAPSSGAAAEPCTRMWYMDETPSIRAFHAMVSA